MEHSVRGFGSPSSGISQHADIGFYKVNIKVGLSIYISIKNIGIVLTMIAISRCTQGNKMWIHGPVVLVEVVGFSI